MGQGENRWKVKLKTAQKTKASSDKHFIWKQVIPPILEELKTKARALGLWNLFLGRDYTEGAGLTNLEYSLIAEITGRCPKLAPEAMNCSAPDTGNMGKFFCQIFNELKRQALISQFVDILSI